MLRAFVVPIAVILGTAVGIFIRPEFFDVPSLILTLGGAVTVTCLSYSRNQLYDLIDTIGALFRERPQSLQEHIDELARLNHLYRLEGLRGLESQEPHLADPFLREGVGMLVDLHKQEIIHARLERELASVVSRNEISRQILVMLAKLLPSFGLIGTLTGMVLMLKNIAGENIQSLPAALSLAVLTTLYGAVLANVAVTPLAARLHAVAVETETKMRLTLEWVLMLLRGEGTAKTLTKWNGSLPPHEINTGREPDWTPGAILTQR